VCEASAKQQPQQFSDSIFCHRVFDQSRRPCWLAGWFAMRQITDLIPHLVCQLLKTGQRRIPRDRVLQAFCSALRLVPSAPTNVTPPPNLFPLSRPAWMHEFGVATQSCKEFSTLREISRLRDATYRTPLRILSFV
jgi:hypothetical protein